MLNGIIVIDKPEGYTSHDCVAVLRGILKQKRIGHTGTLDPMATGVLPVMLGKATSLSNELMSEKKTYIASVKLGVETDTYDITGNILYENDITVNREQLKNIIADFIGEQEQVPPMYSAIKVNGKKLYELARAGVEIERKKRKITIYDIDILEATDLSKNQLELRIICSKGTYIRSLAHDIGIKLGCGATLNGLIREESGNFNLSNACKLIYLKNLREELEKNSEDVIAKISEYIIPVDKVLDKYDAFYSNSSMIDKIVNNGGFLDKALVDINSDIIRVYDSNNNFIGLFQLKKDRYVPKIMLKE